MSLEPLVGRSIQQVSRARRLLRGRGEAGRLLRLADAAAAHSSYARAAVHIMEDTFDPLSHIFAGFLCYTCSS